jgi:hypothetical protein
MYTRVANVGQRDLDEYVMANFESLKPRTLKQRMTIWAFKIILAKVELQTDRSWFALLS